MDFIERWLHISPDGGNGASELLIMTAIIMTVISLTVAIHRYFPKHFIQFLKQLTQGKNSERSDKGV